jgi:Ca2+/H+ antiporter
MANRNWASGGKMYSMHVKPVMITATIQIGAAGAVSSFVGSAVESVARMSLGVYKITMQANSNFSRLYFASGSAQSASGGLSGVLGIEIQNNPNASVQASTASITVKCLDAAGALVNPASGSAINVMIICSDSSIVIGGE